MIAGIGAAAFVLMALIGLAIITSKLFDRGLQLGTRPDDAVVRVGLKNAEAFDIDAESLAWEDSLLPPVAVVEVDNRGAGPVVVTYAAYAVSVSSLWVRDPMSIQIPLVPRTPRAPIGTILGATDALESRSWRMPIPRRTRAVNVVVRLDQVGGRVRRITHVLKAPEPLYRTPRLGTQPS